MTFLVFQNTLEAKTFVKKSQRKNITMKYS